MDTKYGGMSHALDLTNVVFVMDSDSDSESADDDFSDIGNILKLSVCYNSLTL